MSSAAESANKSNPTVGIRVNRRRYYSDDPSVQLLKPPFFKAVADDSSAVAPSRACWNEESSGGFRLGLLMDEAMNVYGQRADRTAYEEYRQRAILWRGATKKLPLEEMADPRFLEARVCHLDPSVYRPTETLPLTRDAFAVARGLADEAPEALDRRYRRYCEAWSHADWFFSCTDGQREYLVVFSRKAGVRYFKPGDPEPDALFFTRLRQIIFDICRNSPKG